MIIFNHCRGASVIVELRMTYPLTVVGSNPLDTSDLSCEDAIQLAYGTSVVLLRWSVVLKIVHGRATEVYGKSPYNIYNVCAK